MRPRFHSICTYVSGQYDDDESFQGLEKELVRIEKEYVDQNEPKNRVMIVEKSFGEDLESSREMQVGLAKYLPHRPLLGKEMVNNLLVLRFANVMLDASFNKSSSRTFRSPSFQEPFGTEGRGGYLDEFGIIRDVMQNHLLQVLNILTVGRPVSSSSATRRSVDLAYHLPFPPLTPTPSFSLQVKVLRYIPPIKLEEVLLGQYVSTETKDGSKSGTSTTTPFPRTRSRHPVLDVVGEGGAK
ncbi:hypothetical protein RQP46_002596 [Phenoliferia psychrophenolica]